MKLTFSTLASPNWTLLQIAENARAAGLDGIDFRGVGAELDITRLPAFNADLDATLQLLAENKLAMPCLNTSVTLVTPEPVIWDTMAAEALDYAKLAHRCATPFLRVFGGSIPHDMAREDARRLAVQHLGHLVNLCKPYGCKPLLETHDSWALSHQILPLLCGFDPMEVGVLWDVEHPWRAGESPAETVDALGNFIKHIHLKDSVCRQGKSIPKLLGDGEIPLSNCLWALKKLSYEGWICLESEKRWHPEGPDPEQSLPQFASYMRNACLFTHNFR